MIFLWFIGGVENEAPDPPKTRIPIFPGSFTSASSDDPEGEVGGQGSQDSDSIDRWDAPVSKVLINY